MIFGRAKMADTSKGTLIAALLMAAVSVVGPILRNKISEELKALTAKMEATPSPYDDVVMRLIDILLKVE